MKYQSQSNNDIRKKIEDYSYGLKDNIGRGFSSVVFKGLNQRTQEQVAIKVIDMKSIKDKIGRQMLEGEIEALRKLNHPNIMKCFDIYSTVNNCYIITEFCNQGDLQNLLKKRGKLSQSQAIPIFRDIFLGFKNIAQSGFLHRDIKPANIFLKDKVAKIGDFGFSKRITSNSKQSTNVGSPLYMSPEALKHNIYTVKNDIWSLGVLLYEMVHGKAPWQCGSQKQLYEKIIKNNIVFGKMISQEMKDFIRKCLLPEEDKRLGLTDISNHPFINKMMEDDIPKLLRKPTSYQTQNPALYKQHSNNVIPTHPKQLTVDISDNIHFFHHRNQNSVLCKTEKQIFAQINWMQFLYRLNEFFPCISKNSKFTMGLRYIIVKQLFCQIFSLKESLKNVKNWFNFTNLEQFIKRNESKIIKYQEVLQAYEKKCQKLRDSFEEWGKAIIKDKRLTSIVDSKFQRTQYLSIVGVTFCIQECKTLWHNLKFELSKDSSQILSEDALNMSYRLDFLMSYYILNCLLLDQFNDADLFARNSKIEIINDYTPFVLQRTNIKEIQSKLHVLEIAK